MKIQERVSDEETANELSESAFQLFFQERNKVEFFPLFWMKLRNFLKYISWDV